MPVNTLIHWRARSSRRWQFVASIASQRVQTRQSSSERALSPGRSVCESAVDTAPPSKPCVKNARSPNGSSCETSKSCAAGDTEVDFGGAVCYTIRSSLAGRYLRGRYAVNTKTLREQLEFYAKQKYHTECEQLPFNHEDYAILRHTDSGKWFAVFIVKPRSKFGLNGDGEAEIVSLKIRDPLLADMLTQQPGYLRGYPSSKWNWVSVVLDGTVPFDDICRWLDESYAATRSGAKNQRKPLIRRL